MNRRPMTPRLAAVAQACRMALCSSVGASLLFAGWPVVAAPTNGSVKAGTASIGQNGNRITVSQTSARAVIDWRSFSVNANEEVLFAQPSTTAATLNRVIGTDPSSILGRITSNGQVFLVNPNGVLFGQGAQINVGGLVASTADISDQNFMAGNYRFDRPGNAEAKVVNEGTIRVAEGGIAALVGRQVSNRGFIVASLGKVSLAAGDAFVLDLTGDRLVNLILDASLMEKVADANGTPLIARVDNTGNIQAGRVELTADTVSRLLDNVINVQGDIRATTASASGGVISLLGGQTTDVTVGGVLQASGGSRSMAVTGRDITLAPLAQIDLGTGASLSLEAARNVTVNASLNALRSGSQPGGNLTITAGDDLTVNQTIALNNGDLNLTATAGRLQTAAGVLLQAGDQPVMLNGAAGVSVGSVLTAGAVNITSASGSVTVGGVIAAPGEGTAAPAGAVTVGGQTVTLNAVRAASVDATSTIGALLAQGVIDADGRADLDAAGALSVSAQGIRSRTAGTGIALRAAGDVLLVGDLSAEASTVSLTSTGGAVTATVAAPGGDAQPGDAAISAGSDATASIVRVNAGGDVTLGAVIAGRAVEVASTNGNVRMLSRLGGENTGYNTYALGYQTALRPNVGSLDISAPNGSVELNGLNLDGIADPPAAGPGLRVTAGRMIVSNDTIAVNKGAIVLAAGSGATDGVFLGHNVFSRGWDFVGIDNARGGSGSAADVKVGYSITITGRNLGLFDNNAEVAELPGIYAVTVPSVGRVLTDSEGFVVDANGVREASPRRVIKDGNVASLTSDLRIVAASDPDAIAHKAVIGTPVHRIVDKIEIANNVANYQDTDAALRDTLVPLTTGGAQPRIIVDVTSIGGVTNASVIADGAGGARQSLGGFAPSLGSLSETQTRTTVAAGDSTRVASTRGIALKLLGFETAADRSTETWNATVAFTAAPANPNPNVLYGADNLFASFESLTPGTFRATSATPEGLYTAPQNGRFTVTVRGSFERGTESCDDCVATYTMQRLPGSLSGFAQIAAIDIVGQAPSTTTNWRPSALGETSRAQVGNNVQIRFGTTPTIGNGGVAIGVEVRGSLLSSAASAGYGGLVTSAGALATTTPVAVQVARWAQASDGTLTTRYSAFDPPGSAYAIGRVVVDTSAAGTYGSSLRGTRVQLFDGVLDNQLGRAQTDATGGPNFVPGFGGIQGRNNSTTGFSPVGTSTSSVAPSSSTTTTAPLGPTPPPPDPGFVFVPPTPTGDATSDLARVASGVGKGQEGDRSDLALTEVELGTRPAAQADLGRSAGVAGASANVFKRKYRVVTARDGSVCDSEDVAAATGAPPPRAPGAALPRECRAGTQ